MIPILPDYLEPFSILPLSGETRVIDDVLIQRPENTDVIAQHVYSALSVYYSVDQSQRTEAHVCLYQDTRHCIYVSISRRSGDAVLFHSFRDAWFQSLVPAAPRVRIDYRVNQEEHDLQSDTTCILSLLYMLRSRFIDIQREAASALVSMAFGANRRELFSSFEIPMCAYHMLRVTTDCEVYRLLLTMLMHLRTEDIPADVLFRNDFQSPQLERTRLSLMSMSH